MIAVASDHAGFLLKQELLQSFALTDYGTSSTASCNYSDYARKTITNLKQDDLAILICGTGIGMSIVANRFSFIRDALCFTPDMAKLAREHNNANVLCLGARLISSHTARAITQQFLNSQFLGGRHQSRLDSFKNLGS
jgi:ribose 5-phosphate isomerase B